MCGIAGLVHREPDAPVSEAVLHAMQTVLTHRGPDDRGVHAAPGVGLVSTRLAIIDLSHLGHMPMRTADCRYHIVYNGEIYNYRELRSLLEAQGVSFRSNSDTEVLLQLFVREGVAMLPRLNGMFAFAIWDSRERELWLARDRLGVKPLYFAERGETLLFASEQKALFAAGVPVAFDHDTWSELLCFRYVAGDRTPYVGIQRLLPGHYLRWRLGRVSVAKWWDLAARARDAHEGLPEDAARWFRDTFDDAVNVRRISDVPVGVLLSGGFDSSSVATSLAAQAGAGVASFTVGFAEADHDESALARDVARASGLAFHALTLAPEALANRLDEASYLNDEPLAHSSDVHLWAIAEYAKPRVTVLLSGEGSDETLGGYVRYQPLRYPRSIAAARRVLPRVHRAFSLPGRVAKLARFLSMDSIRQFVLFNACDVLPADLAVLGHQPSPQFAFRETVVSQAESLYPGDPARQAMFNDQLTFLNSLLHRNDRMTMGASIECRVPFLDYRLVEGLSALPSSVVLAGRAGKPLLRKAMASRLPDSIRRHRKWGFAVPWAHYLRVVPTLRRRVIDLPEHELIVHGPFARDRVRAVVRAFLDGDTSHAALVKQLVMVQAWHRVCVTDRPRPSRSRIVGAAERTPATTLGPWVVNA
jgi:asparagine synthase (glutamine-hydrolysing)